ncbi:AAA family ATPase [Nesterenkonia muleiensis]|uniref:AAA family ATPase n=1 Tax=Nesterenkonia muleiensis TaxID=2282648 RepID=UPI0030829D64
MISGLPGTGKSAVAERAAAALSAVHVSIDAVEEALLASGVQRGWTAGVAAYEAARAVAETSLRAGTDVVVDAVNDSEPARETWRRAARGADAELHFVVLICSDNTAHQSRLVGRNRGFEQVGEPSWEAVVQRQHDYAPWTDPHMVIDTAFGAVDDVVSELLENLPRRIVSGTVHHIELRVLDVEGSTASWEWLLDRLGYTEYQRWPEGISWILGDTYVVLEQTLNSPAHDRRGAGLNHLAFHAGTREDVDALWNELSRHGWNRLYEDRHPFAGGPDYYAAFAENAERFKVELVADPGDYDDR